MSKHTLKINMANMKAMMDNDYFTCKDIFYKSLILSILNAYTILENQSLKSRIILDDSQYHQLYSRHIHTNDVKGMVSELGSFFAMGVYVDVSIYIETFINKYLNHRCSNLLHVAMEDNGLVLITLRYLKNASENSSISFEQTLSE